MIRFILCFIVLRLVVGSGASLGQSTVRLELKPERMQKARKTEQEALAKNDSLLLAEAWYLYGKMYVLAGDYQAAQAYYMKALRVHEPRGDSPELSRLYIRLSENEGRLGHLNESFALAERALTIARRIRSDISLIRAYGMLGQLYEKKWGHQLLTDRKKYDRILDYYRKEESLCYKLNDSMGVAEVSTQIGTFLTKTKNVAAIQYLQKAVRLFDSENKTGNRVDAVIHLAGAYLMANKTKLAYAALQEAEKTYTAKRLDDYTLRLGLEQNYVSYFRATSRWREAFEHLEKLNRLEKSQLLADNNGAITRLNIEYETEKKEALLTLQKNELVLRDENLRTQQRFTAAMSALFALTAGMSLVFFRLYRKNQRISRQNAELVKEQNHRVKNNLQIVSSLLSLQSKRLTDDAAKEAVEESRLRVESMAILHRRLYDGDKLARVNVDEFIRELVSSVLKSYGYDGIQPEFRIATIQLSADKAVPLGLIMNELTTNACKYAFPATETPRYVVRCSQHKQLITLDVADNGPGLDRPGRANTRPEESTRWGTGPLTGTDVLTAKKTSFGIQLIQAQAEQLRGTYQFGTVDGAATGVLFTMEFNV